MGWEEWKGWGSGRAGRSGVKQQRSLILKSSVRMMWTLTSEWMMESLETPGDSDMLMVENELYK